MDFSSLSVSICLWNVGFMDAALALLVLILVKIEDSRAHGINTPVLSPTEGTSII